MDTDTAIRELGMVEEKVIDLCAELIILRSLNRELVEALGIIVANAEIQPDARMDGATDIYAVPLDDVENARSILAKAKEVK